jgi:glycosyltransferase involved in cell wall biosynthesis
LKVIVAFYASSQHGSEYRAGAEFISFAHSLGFDVAVIADLEQNDLPVVIQRANPGMSVVHVPSIVRKQRRLYRYADFLPQWIWHRRVAKWLNQQAADIEVLWIHNGALPWLPLSPYVPLAKKLIWGPVGGGEAAPSRALNGLSLYGRWREVSRSILARALLRRKSALGQNRGADIVPLARTLEARRLLAEAFPTHSIPIIPEILRPVSATQIERRPSRSPKFIWVGQDVPRKNLALALEMFSNLRKMAFPDATLDVFGPGSQGRSHVPGVTYHGWVSKIPWNEYCESGVLLLTSFREGLPSVVLEALSRGLLCVASEVGALSTLAVSTLEVLPRQEYPQYEKQTYSRLERRIREHLGATRIELREVNYEPTLRTHLADNGIV